jgi:hypothetical protein
MFGKFRDCMSNHWLQIGRSGSDSRGYLIFWEVVGLERGPLSLVSTIEEVLERKSSGSGLEIREYGHRYPSRWPRGTIYPPKLSLSSPTSSGRSVGIVCSQTQATEFSFMSKYWLSEHDSLELATIQRNAYFIYMAE